MRTSEVKLGRKAVVTDSRTLRLSKFFTSLLAPPPVSRSWIHGVVNWGALGNIILGDCTIAGAMHGVQTWTVNVLGKPAAFTFEDAVHYYEIWDGYNPNDPSTDQGGILLNCCKLWKAQTLKGYDLKAFATVLPATIEHVKQAINLFGGLYIGLNVPAYIMPQDGNVPEVWNVEPNGDNSIIGGHCVFVTGYDENVVDFISWGTNYSMTWAFWTKFVDESYALLSSDWIEANGGAPNGFDLAALESDLVEIN
jgi:hypothetical protein